MIRPLVKSMSDPWLGRLSDRSDLTGRLSTSPPAPGALDDYLIFVNGEGLIARLSQRGFVVRQFTREEIGENYHLRQLLEAEAARLATGSIATEELRDLRQTNQAIARAIAKGRTSDLVDLNARFHRLVREASRMPGLTRLIEQLCVGTTVLTPLFVPDRSRRSVQEHQALIAALEARNGARAAEVMRQHIHRAWTEYFSTLEEGGGQRAGTRRGAP